MGTRSKSSSIGIAGFTAAAIAAVLAIGERNARADATGEALFKYAGTHAGVGAQGIGGVEPRRTEVGAYFRFDIHLVSLFVPQPRYEEKAETTTGVAVYDALFADFFFGKLISEPAKDESTLGIGYGFGYEGLVGWRTPRFGALGGVRYAAKGAATTDLATGLGIEARGELVAWGNAPLSAQIWTKPWGDSKVIGVEAHVPISTHVWFYGRFDYATFPAPPSTPTNPDPSSPSVQTVSVGVGFGRWG